MSVKEAHVLLASVLPNVIVVSCYDYATVFVFDTKSNGLVSVNKQSGLVRDFKPFHISMEEYMNGKQIVNFK